MSGQEKDPELCRCQDDIAACARAAVEAYTPLAERSSPITHERLAGAVRCVIRLRDALIDGRRRGLDVEERLRRVNSILSLAVSAEFPIVGVRHERIVATRESLSRLVSDFRDPRGRAGAAAGWQR